ncbi:MAG: hypothetical protein ACYSSI_04855 [Planctomycetota bacterium]|jgi:hypothetical protein
MKKEPKNKSKLIVLFVGISVVLVVLALRFVLLTHHKFRQEFFYKHAYRECNPDKLLSELKKVFDINFPVQIEGLKTARTSGSWDGYYSPFIVKFTADPNIVAGFLKSIPRQIRFELYKPNYDSRNIESLLTPQWFIEPIKGGKIGRIHGHGDLKIYIDTTNKEKFVVYFKGVYERDPEEVSKEFEELEKLK